MDQASRPNHSISTFETDIFGNNSSLDGETESIKNKLSRYRKKDRRNQKEIGVFEFNSFEIERRRWNIIFYEEKG